MANALRVRGTCPKCKHVVNTTAPAGKATWRGPCPQDSCAGTVIARRVKVDAKPAAEPEEPPAEPQQRGRQRRKPTRVDHYDERRDEHPVPRADPGDSAPAEPVAQPGPGEHGGPPERERPPRRRVSPYEEFY